MPSRADCASRLRRGQSLACRRSSGGPHVSDQDSKDNGVDKVTIAYIVGGIPAIVGFVVILFTLVTIFNDIPA